MKLKILIDEIDLPIIVDAGIGKPSQACEAMEMGASAIMANTAIATSGDIVKMASAFKKAIEAGREAYLAGLAIHVANFSINEQDYSVLLRYFSFGLYRLKSYRVRFEQEKNALFASN